MLLVLTPAYQNLHQRVEGTVASFLATQEWRQEMNKNQLRDSLRKHIHESGFLDLGVERIVDQVVNPKILTVLLPQIEDVATNKEQGNQIIMASLQLQSAKAFKPLKMETLEDLLPKDLDPISPGSVGVASDDDDDHDHLAAERERDQERERERERERDGGEEMEADEEDSSPPFEPIDAPASAPHHDAISLRRELHGQPHCRHLRLTKPRQSAPTVRSAGAGQVPRPAARPPRPAPARRPPPRPAHHALSTSPAQDQPAVQVSSSAAVLS
ncbi:Uncharacterized protein GBIM_06214 [Gryllus bimaculatus]|nr:Uncharacterized protein GBIM_06214 [Gryllus bimaculatus]